MEKRANPDRSGGVDGAFTRLEAALAKLESALPAAGARGEDRRRVAELEAEVTRLLGEQRELGETTEHVARRLDDTIRRLRAAQPNDA